VRLQLCCSLFSEPDRGTEASGKREKGSDVGPRGLRARTVSALSILRSRGGAGHLKLGLILTSHKLILSIQTTLGLLDR
jgi:hypothetical protein